MLFERQSEVHYPAMLQSNGGYWGHFVIRLLDKNIHVSRRFMFWPEREREIKPQLPIDPIDKRSKKVTELDTNQKAKFSQQMALKIRRGINWCP